MINLLSKKARTHIEEDLTPYEILQDDFLKNDFLTATDRKKLKSIKEAFESYTLSKIERLTVFSSSFIGEHLVRLMADKTQEEVLVLSLNTKNEVISIDRVFKGSLNTSVAHPREIFKTAISHSAARIILAHNHPSGDTDPSEADLSLTRRVVESGELLGIECLDHFIIGRDYLSLREHGLM